MSSSVACGPMGGMVEVCGFPPISQRTRMDGHGAFVRGPALQKAIKAVDRWSYPTLAAKTRRSEVGHRRILQNRSKVRLTTAASRVYCSGTNLFPEQIRWQRMRRFTQFPGSGSGLHGLATARRIQSPRHG